jgi:hypothetical protein
MLYTIYTGTRRSVYSRSLLFTTARDFIHSKDHLAVARLDVATSLSDHALSLDGLMSITLIDLKRPPVQIWRRTLGRN